MGPGRCGGIQHSWAAFLEHSASFPHSLFVLRSPADAEPSGPSSECHLASRKEAGFSHPSVSGALRESVK